MDSAQPAQTMVKQGSGGFFGGLMKGFCFVAGTEIRNTRRWQGY